jgi:hypothetical protein
MSKSDPGPQRCPGTQNNQTTNPTPQKLVRASRWRTQQPLEEALWPSWLSVVNYQTHILLPGTNNFLLQISGACLCFSVVLHAMHVLFIWIGTHHFWSEGVNWSCSSLSRRNSSLNIFWCIPPFQIRIRVRVLMALEKIVHRALFLSTIQASKVLLFLPPPHESMFISSWYGSLV